MAGVLVRSEGLRRVYLGLTWALAWMGMGLQFWLTLGTVNSQGRSTVAAAVVFLSYFTVLTNLLVAAALTAELMGWVRESAWWVTAESAVALYIAVVGMSYFLLLRNVWDPQGWQWVANGLQHYVVPLVFVGWWLGFVTKGRLRWSLAGWWLLYPAVYMVATAARGASTGLYPYWFIDVSRLGYPRALMNAAGFTAVFLIGGLGVVALDRWLGRVRRPLVARSDAGTTAPL